ncbi:MAG: PGAP1-like protein [bacterium ADurb.Bin429]|nr:MAG: PGAP1-like protein [bacterium ADurb.Bin429]
MSTEYMPVIFIHGWGGVSDMFRDFDEHDERDPYIGWNDGCRYNDPEGWLKLRETPNFEGMVFRLVKDYNYYDAANDESLTLLTQLCRAYPTSIPPGLPYHASDKTIWIFRYYEYNADHLHLSQNARKALLYELQTRGYKGPLAGIPYYAALLALTIRRIAGKTCYDLEKLCPGTTPTARGLGLKRVALVGHSMGGLIARFAIQYNLYDTQEYVGKLATLATPHGGARYAIASRMLRWLPGLTQDDVMYLDPSWVNKHLGGQNPQAFHKPLPPSLKEEDVFCLIGTRRDGYFLIARRLPRTDGIVHQDEAYLQGFPYAYFYQTHSGSYGIRENLAPYQALRRFLFGDLHVKIWVESVQFGASAQHAHADNRFFFRYGVKPRGINVYLNEISEECENQPKPRTLAELNSIVSAGRYVVYDGFADSAAVVPLAGLEMPGVAASEAEVPHLQIEHRSYLYNAFVGGMPVGSNYTMVPLILGVTHITASDQEFNFTLGVSVTKR